MLGNRTGIRAKPHSSPVQCCTEIVICRQCGRRGLGTVGFDKRHDAVTRRNGKSAETCDCRTRRAIVARLQMRSRRERIRTEWGSSFSCTRTTYCWVCARNRNINQIPGTICNAVQLWSIQELFRRYWKRGSTWRFCSGLFYMMKATYSMSWRFFLRQSLRQCVRYGLHLVGYFGDWMGTRLISKCNVMAPLLSGLLGSAIRSTGQLGSTWCTLLPCLLILMCIVQ